MMEFDLNKIVPGEPPFDTGQDDDLVEWVEVDGIKYAVQQEVADRIHELESELAAFRQQQTFAWNALDSAMIKDHDRTGSLAESITRLAMERDDLRQQQGEPFGWAFQHDETGRWVSVINDGVNNPVIFSKNNPRYGDPIPFYHEAAPRVPDGWKLVPVEPTEEMAKEYWAFNDRTDVVMADAWNALLAAAPEPKE